METPDTFEEYLHSYVPSLMQQNWARRLATKLCPRQTGRYVIWRDTRKNLRILDSQNRDQ